MIREEFGHHETAIFLFLFHIYQTRFKGELVYSLHPLALTP
jgi:hypothetical protein